MLWLVKNSNATWNSQKECILLMKHCYIIKKFVYDNGSRKAPQAVSNILKLHFCKITKLVVNVKNDTSIIIYDSRVVI